MLILALICAGMYAIWSREETEIPPNYKVTNKVVFMFNISYRMAGIKGNFNFVPFAGLIISCCFLRLCLMVKNTSLAGPTIRIIYEMSG